MSKCIFLYGYYGFDNFGDELLLESVCENLLKLNPQSKIYVRSLKDVSFKHPSVISTKSDAILISSWKAPIKFLLYAWKMFLWSFRCDELVIGGGGLFLDKGRFSFHLAVLWMMVTIHKLRAKPVTVLGVSFDFLTGPLTMFFVKGILRGCHFVGVRDSLSQAYAFQISGREINLCSDLTFASTFIQKQPEAGRSNYIGMSFVDYYGSYEINPEKSEVFQKQIQKLCEEFESSRIRYFVFQKDIGLNDKKFIEIIQKKGLAVDVVVAHDWDHFMISLAECSSVITMRYHLALMALRYDIPTFVIDHELKLSSLVTEFRSESMSLNEFMRLTSFEIIHRSLNSTHRKFSLQEESSKALRNFIPWSHV